jgi:adenylate kinase family enzyme
MKSEARNLKSAMLILGPTGSGKTPLGEYLEKRGLCGKRCVHFDFGARLRRIAVANMRPSYMTEDDYIVVLESLRTGALLENENFHIAESILASFAEEQNVGADDLIVLNGLPRHAGQAGDIDAAVKIGLIVYLDCGPEVVSERIRHNSGGDRSGRTDDLPEDMARKLEVFRERTLPLLDHYKAKKVRIVTIAVGVTTTPEEICEKLTRSKKSARKK